MERRTGWYTCLDATEGYFQVPLDEASQLLTVFITPWARYKFLRAAMGLISSVDEFNRRVDAAYSGKPNLAKVVDDFLRYDRTFPDHVRGVCSTLQTTREARITWLLEKFYLPRERFNGLVTSSRKVAWQWILAS